MTEILVLSRSATADVEADGLLITGSKIGSCVTIVEMAKSSGKVATCPKVRRNWISTFTLLVTVTEYVPLILVVLSFQLVCGESENLLYVANDVYIMTVGKFEQRSYAARMLSHLSVPSCSERL